MLSPVYGYAWKGKTAVPARWQKPSMVSAISPRGEIPSEIVEGGIKTTHFFGGADCGGASQRSPWCQFGYFKTVVPVNR